VADVDKPEEVLLADGSTVSNGERGLEETIKGMVNVEVGQ
jgi:hypothetical protein